MLKNLTSYGVRIYIEDKNLVCSRPVTENLLLAVGDNIEISKQKNNEQHESKRYSISFNKNIFVEEDASKNCKNYPSNEFVTYKECEYSFIHNFYKKYGQLNPIWAPDLSRNISGPTFIPNLTGGSHFHNLAPGATPSDFCAPDRPAS